MTYSTAGGNQTMNFTGKTQAVVKLAGLNDTVSVRLSADQTKSVKVTAELGGGDDSFLFGVDPGATIRGLATVHLHVKGGDGDDQVVIQNSPDLFGGRFVVQANLGRGNDTFIGSVGALNLGGLRGSVASFLINGGEGDDSIHVLAGGTALPIDLACSLSVIARGGAGDDFISADCLYTDGGGSNAVRVVLDGEAGNDVLVADLERPLGAPDTLFRTTLRGGAGDDDLMLSVVGHSPAGLLDGGTGIDIGFGDYTTFIGCEFF